jgi:DNA ligase-associated metallophosphoesterase
LAEPFVVEIAGETLHLLPGRAVYWPRERSLIVADTHFGKDDVFRRAGIALPRGPAIADLQRLTTLLTATESARLVVLGDFLHGATRPGDSFPRAFAAWRAAHASLSIDVAGGNHDRHEARERWSGLIDWHARLIERPFVFAHEPQASAEGYVLAGHLHPAILLPGVAGGRVPVFWLRRDVLVLPSFGSFTGGAIVRPERGERIYAVAPERIVPIPGSP